jgi:hypothetical protein
MGVRIVWSSEKRWGNFRERNRFWDEKGGSGWFIRGTLHGNFWRFAPWTKEYYVFIMVTLCPLSIPETQGSWRIFKIWIWIKNMFVYKRKRGRQMHLYTLVPDHTKYTSFQVLKWKTCPKHRDAGRPTFLPRTREMVAWCTWCGGSHHSE